MLIDLCLHHLLQLDMFEQLLIVRELQEEKLYKVHKKVLYLLYIHLLQHRQKLLNLLYQRLLHLLLLHKKLGLNLMNYLRKKLQNFQVL